MRTVVAFKPIRRERYALATSDRARLARGTAIDASHFMAEDRPEEVAAVLLEFLAGAEGPAAVAQR